MSNQAVSSARQVVVTEPMKPVPDFWAGHSDNLVWLATHDRLDRKNLPMLYHFSYDQYHRADLPVVPGIGISPEPRLRNHSNDLDARLNALRESADGGSRALTPTIPPPPSDDSRQPASVKLRKISGVQGIVAIDDL